MKKGVIFTTMFICIALVFTFMFIVLKAPTTTINEGVTTQYLKEIEKAFTPAEYLCDNDFCWVDDEQIYLNCTAESFNPICKIETKNYNGDADIVFLFDTNEIEPISLEYNPHYVDVEKSYTCNYEANFTQDPKYYYCFETLDYLDFGNGTIRQESIIIHSHGPYDSGNAQTKTAYWTEQKLEWNKYNKGYNREDIDFKNMTRKYTLHNISFNSGIEKTFKLNLKPIGFTQSHKYWIGIKPSHLTWNEAIEQNKYFVLDPWTPSLDTSLAYYWAMNYTTGAVQDGLGNKDLTAFGTTRGIEGVSNNSFYYNAGSTSYLYGTSTGEVGVSQSWTLSMWVNMTNVEGIDPNPMTLFYDTTGGSDRVNLQLRNNEITARIYSGGVDKQIKGAHTMSNNTWAHIVLVYNGNDTGAIYVDGSTVSGGGVSAITGDAVSLNIGRQGTATYYVTGLIDEVAIWGRALTVSEIGTVWAGGLGSFKYGTTAPEIKILFPVNNTVYNESVNQLNYTVDTAEYCWYSADAGGSNSSFVVAGNNFSISTIPQWNNFTIYCNDTGENIGLNDTIFFVNKSVGTNLIYPINNLLTANSSILFDYNNTVLNTNLTNSTFYLWWDNGTLLDSRFYTLSGNQTINNKTIIILGEGGYIWNVETCGSAVSCNFGSSNYSFDLDLDGPIPIITYPTGVLGAVVDGTTLNLNWTISETGENLTTHLKNCSYTYNGSTTYMVKATCLANVTTFSYSAGKDNITFRAWDIFNLSNEDTATWIVSLSEINQTYNAFTTEGATEDFLIYVSVNPTYSITASQLIYNGTTYTGVTTDLGGNVFRASRTITIPSVTATGNVTFYWRFAFNDTSIVNSLSKNQSIANVLIDNCGSYTYKLLELEAIDEEEQTHLNETTLNTSIEVDLQVFSNDLSVSIINYSNIFNRTNPISICTNSNMTNALKYDTIIKYSAENYSSEYYNVQRGTLQYGLIPYNISLFDLLSEDATEFQITFKDSSFLVIEDALINIARQYVGEGTFKTVEIPKTDSNGQTVAHLVTNDVIYNMVVTKEGEVLGVFNNLVAFCDDIVTGSCFINLNAIGNNTELYSYSSSTGISYNKNYNKTSRLLTFEFVTTDGNIKTINLTAVKMDQLGNTTACNEVLISSSGTIYCTIPASIGNDTIIMNIYADGQLVANDYIKTGDNFSLGDMGYLFLIFMLLSFPLMFSSSKIGVIIGVLLGFISASLFGIIQGGVIGLGASLLWLIISGLILIYIINTKRET